MKWQYRFGTKAIAVFLLTILCFSTLASGIGFLWMAETGHYERDSSIGDKFSSASAFRQEIYDYNEAANEWFALYSCQDRLSEEEAYRFNQVLTPKLRSEDTNYGFIVRSIAIDNEEEEISSDNSEEILYSSEPIAYLLDHYSPVRNFYSERYTSQVSSDDTDSDDTETREERVIRIEPYIRKDISQIKDVFYEAQAQYDMADNYKEIVIVVLGISAFLTIANLIFVLCIIGHRPDREEAVTRTFDRWPFEIVTGAVAVAVGCGATLLFEMVQEVFAHFTEILIAGAFILLVMGIAALVWVLTLAVRLKTHTFVQSSWICSAIQSCWGILGKIGENMNLLWKALLIPFACAFVLLISSNFGLFGVMLAVIMLYAVWCAAMLELKMLADGASHIAAGDMAYQLDTQKLHGFLKTHGENLNHIRGGIAGAVEQRLRSERMKTELLTNVSHDIKTPLTSIINYVDLLGQEEVQSERVQEYLAVLERQSARLKKLLEDLIEASKAASGNIALNLEPVHVGELLRQAAGEYSEKLKKAELDLILNVPEEEVAVFADGRLLWRVLDNLMNNVSKYALCGTRVYVDLEAMSDRVVISVKNTSRDRLNISTEELMERFVRGDASRSGEGSGLGLSIARGLTERMGGQFAIIIDGDLFKATVTFPKA